MIWGYQMIILIFLFSILKKFSPAPLKVLNNPMSINAQSERVLLGDRLFTVSPSAGCARDLNFETEWKNKL